MKSLKLKQLIAASLVTLVAMTTTFSEQASAAWREAGNGSWNYTNDENSLARGWNSIDNNWYFFDSNGTMKTGWFLDGSSWYYLDESGAMKTGWVNTNGSWYYMGASGSMQTGWINDSRAIVGRDLDQWRSRPAWRIPSRPVQARATEVVDRQSIDRRSDCRGPGTASGAPQARTKPAPTPTQ